MPAVFLDDAMRYGQSQGCALSHFLGGKKGFEDILDDFFGDSAAGIGDADDELVAVGV